MNMNTNQELPTLQELNARLDKMEQDINESDNMLEEIKRLIDALKSEK
jgi:hypothetical protein